MGVPAVVLGRRTDVLAWNARAHRLLAGHIAPDARPNLTRLLFLDAHTRELYARWDEEAARAVAMLRILAGRFPDDPELAELVGELSMKSPEFAALWAKHPVANCVSGPPAPPPTIRCGVSAPNTTLRLSPSSTKLSNPRCCGSIPSNNR